MAPSCCGAGAVAPLLLLLLLTVVATATAADRTAAAAPHVVLRGEVCRGPLLQPRECVDPRDALFECNAAGFCARGVMPCTPVAECERMCDAARAAGGTCTKSVEAHSLSCGSNNASSVVVGLQQLTMVVPQGLATCSQRVFVGPPAAVSGEGQPRCSGCTTCSPDLVQCSCAPGGEACPAPQPPANGTDVAPGTPGAVGAASSGAAPRRSSAWLSLYLLLSLVAAGGL